MCGVDVSLLGRYESVSREERTGPLSYGVDGSVNYDHIKATYCLACDQYLDDR